MVVSTICCVLLLLLGVCISIILHGICEFKKIKLKGYNDIDDIPCKKDNLQQMHSDLEQYFRSR